MSDSQQTEQLMKAMRAASDKAHEIVGGIQARDLVKHKMPQAMRLKIASDIRSDSEIVEIAADLFEILVRALGAAGDPDVSIHECGAKDMEPNA